MPSPMLGTGSRETSIKTKQNNPKCALTITAWGDSEFVKQGTVETKESPYFSMGRSERGFRREALPEPHMSGVSQGFMKGGRALGEA